MKDLCPQWDGGPTVRTAISVRGNANKGGGFNKGKTSKTTKGRGGATKEGGKVRSSNNPLAQRLDRKKGERVKKKNKIKTTEKGIFKLR